MGIASGIGSYHFRHEAMVNHIGSGPGGTLAPPVRIPTPLAYSDGLRATVSVAVTGFRGTEMTFWVTVTDVAAILDDQTGHAALDVTYEWHNGGQVGDVIERLLFSGVATAAY